MPTVLASEDDVVVGVLLWHRHFSAAAEVHLMAVDGRGIAPGWARLSWRGSRTSCGQTGCGTSR